MKKYLAALTAAVLILLLSGCAPREQDRYVYAMDTVMTLRLSGDDGTVFSLCEEKIQALEDLFSTNLPDSDISRLNESGSAALSAETLSVIDEGLSVSENTGGAFSLSLYPVTRLWGFTTGDYHVPGEEELFALRPLVNDRLIIRNGDSVSLGAGQKIDLGGIAKGYTGEALASLLKENNIRHAFLSLGGNVEVLGGSPDGSPWRVGIADPDGGEYLGVVTLRDGAVVTSGGYQRNFTENGTLYHHIIDPQTLSPAASGLKSVTVIADSGTLADALSTALFVMGAEKALSYQASCGDFECILVTDDNRILTSSGIKSNFTPHNMGYTYEK